MIQVCDVKALKASVQQRLSAAAEEIFEIFERTVTEYEEELQRQRRLLELLNPQVHLDRTDVQLLLSVVKEEVQPDPPELPPIKEEQQELLTSHDGEQLQGLEEAQITKFTFSPVPMKIEEDEEKPESSHLHLTEDLKIEDEDSGGLEPEWNQDDDQLKTSSEHPSVLNFVINAGEKSFVCPECGKRFSDNSNLKRHTKIHTGEKPFSCSVCCRRFIQKVHLKRHMMRHMVRELYSCSHCPRRFVLQSQLRNHKCIDRDASQLHLRPDHEYAEPVNTEADGEDRGGPEPSTDGGLDWAETSEPQSNLNNPTPVGSSDSAPSLNHDDQEQERRGVQTGKKTFNCSVCGKRYFRRNFLMEHLRLHTEGKSFICEVCKKTFKCRSNFLTHMRIHTGEKPFSCSICGKTFTQSSALNLHLRVHTGEKPFSCSVCKATFSFGSNLTQHMRIHTGEKPFSCSMCSRGFIRKEQLRQHVATHTGEKPFSCSVCGKAFAVSSALKSHMRVHTGEKPFACPVCHVSFGFRSNLSTHLRIHSREKPFSCSICGQTFTQFAVMKKHVCSGESSKRK